MPDPRLETWAKALVGFSVDVQAGQTVAITGGIGAEPLLRAVYREVVGRGGNPVMLPTLQGLATDLLRHGSDEQLAFISPVERFLYEQTDVLVNIQAETNTKSLAGIDPARQLARQKARLSLMESYMRRSSKGELQWTLTLYPTDAYAQDAEMATEDFAEFVFAACKLNRPDPVAAWKELAAEQQRLIDWLADKREIHLVGPGTDLTLSVGGRTWVNADGTKNFPDGEVFTGPVETSANGHVSFTYPVSVGGREVVDVRLRFADGKVVEASAAKGEDFLLENLNADEGARYLGEFAFGTNFDVTRFTRNILFDEKIGGTVHMALGAGYPETGNTNTSAIHWDLICDLRQGGRVDVDGQPFLVDGRYVVVPGLAPS
ncbi:MAG: aminopeptidase [Thermomicrobiales bacterium]|nr:aminopeptidase [Thermomicrobiales bacterium]